MRFSRALAPALLSMAMLASPVHGQGAASPSAVAIDSQAQQLNAQGQRSFAAGDFAGAAQAYVHMLALCDRVVPANISVCHFSARMGRGQAHMRIREWAQAVAEFQAAADITHTQFPPNDPRIGSSASLLGTALIAAGRPADAEPWFRAALPFAQSGDGTNALNRGFILHGLALGLQMKNQFSEAAEIAAQAIEVLRPRQDPAGKVWLRRMLLTQATMERMLKRLGRAEAALTECLALAAAAHDTSPLLSEALHQLGLLRVDQERRVEAEKPLRDALALREPLATERPNELAATLLALGKVALMVTRYQEAEALLLRAQTLFVNFGQAGELGATSSRELLAVVRAASAAAAPGAGQAPAVVGTGDSRAEAETRALRLDYEITEHMRQGRGDQAVVAARERIQLLVRLHGAGANITITARIARANQLQSLARLAEAEAEATTALNDLDQQRIPITRARIHNTIALIRTDQGRFPRGGGRAALRPVTAVQCGARFGDGRADQYPAR